MVFIITSLVLIPMQVNQLTTILSMNSMFRQPLNLQMNESHVILCGHVSDFRRMERFFREFFHPDRSNKLTYLSADYHVLILSPLEPSEDLKNLLLSSEFDSRTTYLVGSALSPDDLTRARADTASAMFFLCNSESSKEAAKLDDAATVLRTLSVSNYNPNLQCIVQVLKREDRDILKDR